MDKNKNTYSAKCSGCLFRQMLSKHLSEELIDFHCNNAQHLKFKKGEHILKQGNSFTHIAFLTKGEIKENWEFQPGKNKILMVAVCPALLGYHNLENQLCNKRSVTAITDCEACLFEVEKLKWLATENGFLLLSYLELLCQISKELVSDVENLDYKKLDGKIAAILIYLSKNVYGSDQFELNLSRKELGEMSGCSEENASRYLKKFKKEGIIHYEGKHLKILQMEKLVLAKEKG